MAIPVWSADHIDTKLTILAVPLDIVLVSGLFKIDAGSQSNELVHEATIVNVLNMSQTVEHLCRAHRISNIVDLTFPSLLHDEIHECWVVVKAKLGPTKVPSIERVVILGILFANIAIFGASVVSEPDVVACVKEAEKPGLSD